MDAEHLLITSSRVAAALAIVVGVAVLLGWTFDIIALKGLLPGLATMKANTALAFVLSGTALWFVSRAAPIPGITTIKPQAPRIKSWLGMGCAAAVALLGLLTLGEYVFFWELGIDQLLIEDLAQGGAHPGRMAQGTAVDFVLFAAALLLADVGTQRGGWPAQWLALAVAFTSFVAVLGYAYDVESLYALQAYSSVALHTALTFLVLVVGFLCVRPTRGLMVLATRADSGGVLIRYLFPAAVLVPPVVGWLQLEGRRAGLYSTEFGLAMFATTNVLVFCTLIWWTARSMQAVEAGRRQAESSLRESENRLRTVIDSALSAVIVIDSGGRIADWNTRAEQMFGWTRDEAIGRELAETIIPPHLRETHRRGLARFLATGEGPVLNRLVEMTALRRSGSEFPVDLSISSIRVGDAGAFCGFVTDITERKQAQQALIAERTLLRTLIDALPDVVFTKDTAGRFSMCNAAELKHVGLGREEELVGKSVFDLYPPSLAAGYHADDLQALSGQPVLNREEPSLDAVGNRRWYLTTKVPIHDRAGKVSGIVGISRDITERKQAERALIAERTLLRTLIDALPDVVFAKDASGRYTMCNAASLRHVGLTREEDFVGKSVFDFYPHERAEAAHADDLKALSDRPVFNREEPGVDAAGNEHWFLTTKVPLHDREGKVSGIVGISRDITERKQAEAAFRKSQELLQAVADNASAIIWVKDMEGRYQLINGRYEELIKLRREEIIGKTDYEIFPNEQADIFRAVDRKALAAGRAVEAEEEALYDDGAHVLLSVKTPLLDIAGRPYALFGISADITARKRTEEALRESQERYRTLAESLPHLVWTCTPDGRCDYLSRQWVEYTGRPEEEQLGYGWAEQLHPDDRERIQAAWAEATVRGDRFDVEFRIRRADGVYRWFKTRAVPLRDAAGKIVKWFGSNTDFEEFKRAEQRLETQLERLNLLDQITRAIGQRQDLKSIFQVIVRSLEDHLPIDFGCICLYDAAEDSLTVTCVGVKSEPLALELAMAEHARIDIDENGLWRCVHGELVHEPDVAQVPFPFPQRLAQGGLRSLVVAPLLVESKVFGILVAARREARSFSSGDCEFLRQLSEHVALAAHQAQLYGALQQAYEDLRQTQHTVMQQERLRALGQMASGIAHDINNAISPVALYIESLLEREQKLSKRAREYLTTIQRAIDDVAQTVTRMREFYRPREAQLVLAPVDLNRIVQQVVDLTRARWSDLPQEKGIVIKLKTQLAPDLPAFVGAESEIRDGLTNLIFNAVDAMPEGGTLTLRTRVFSSEGHADDGSVRYVCVEVRDTGIGMDEETRRHCLEPFFTTKGERGTGLGLAMVYGTAQRHSAELQLDSEPGRGTTVRLIFPASERSTTPAVRLPARPAPEQRLRILLVDDDPLFIKSLRDTLEADGHAITSADGGQAGIDAFLAAQKHGSPFAVVITDLGMPYVDGRKVAAAVREGSPGTPIILLTGWGQRLSADNDVPPHVDRVLNKPPRLHELRAALAELTSRMSQTSSS